MAQDVCAYIIADHRESNGANPYLQARVDHNNNHNIKLPWKSGGGSLLFQIVNNGAIGDYSIMVPSRYNPNNMVIAAIFERKAWKDLSASIKDQRLINQHKNMVGIRDSKGCFIYYIIEGGLTYADDTEIGHIPFKNLHAKLRSMSLKGVHSWQTRDQEDTARFLVHISRDLSRLYRQELISFPLQEQHSVNNFKQDLATLINRYKNCIDADVVRLITTISAEYEKITDTVPTIGASEPTMQPILPIELTKRAESSHTDIIMQMWCSIPKVTNKTAPVLMSYISLLDLINTSNTTAIKNTIANMTFASGMKLGPSRADSIVSIAYEGNDPGLLSEAHATHVNIIAQIPGVSTDTASMILKQIPMKQLCSHIKSLIRTDSNETEKNLRSVVNQLATIVKRNGSKLGLSTAQKIVDIITAQPNMLELSHMEV
jgi:ERCC4-type nuclease